jgi:hypothetical protein
MAGSGSIHGRKCGRTQRRPRRDIETVAPIHPAVVDAYFGPFERGGASTGQAYLALPQSIHDGVRKDVQRSLGDTGGPVDIEVEFQFASGQRR